MMDWLTLFDRRLLWNSSLRCAYLFQGVKNGTTTLEVKSGYGLSVVEELKMLRAIRHANEQTDADLIATCLAAHMHPKDHVGDCDCRRQ